MMTMTLPAEFLPSTARNNSDVRNERHKTRRRRNSSPRIECSTRRNVILWSASAAALCVPSPLKLRAEEEKEGILRSAREVVRTLRESLKEDPKDVTKFRRTADAAKESIREYLGAWRGQEKVSNEESYAELVKAFRALAKFYKQAGPFAPLPDEVKSEILGDLSRAEEFL